MSRAIKNKHINDLTALFSEKRLEIALKRGLSGEKAIEFHQARVVLGLRLMAIAGTIEISLRNVVVENMNNHFGPGNWLKANPDKFEWKESDKGSIQKAEDKAYRKTSSRRQKQKNEFNLLFKENTQNMSKEERDRIWRETRPITYSDEDVITNFTMRFWKDLYSRDYAFLWNPVLKHTFSERRMDAGNMKRTNAHNCINLIYASRNRVAHYEPVTGNRFDEVIRAIRFFAHHFNTTQPGPNTALAVLLEKDIDALVNDEKTLR